MTDAELDAPTLLSPCPCCGSEALLSKFMTDGGLRGKIECTSCSLCTSGWDFPNDAVASWNQRADHAATREELDRLRGALSRLTTLYESEYEMENVSRPAWLVEALSGLAPSPDDRDARIERLEALLKPFGDEAEMWGDLVPDDHAPLCVEMGHTNGAYYGSRAKYTVGNLREARAALAEGRA